MLYLYYIPLCGIILILFPQIIVLFYFFGGTSPWKNSVFLKNADTAPKIPIECLQTYSDSKHFVVPMHWHKNVEIMQIYKGSAELAIGTGTYSASAGDILIINQEELHRIESDDPTLHYGTFIFPLQSKKPAYF